MNNADAENQMLFFLKARTEVQRRMRPMLEQLEHIENQIESCAAQLENREPELKMVSFSLRSIPLDTKPKQTA